MVIQFVVDCSMARLFIKHEKYINQQIDRLNKGIFTLIKEIRIKACQFTTHG